MSRRPDRRVTRGRYATPLDNEVKLRRGPAGQHGQIVAPTEDAIRDAVAAGKCPWCGRGPWKVLAAHTHQAHGIDKLELRHLAGVAKKDSICDPSYSQEVAERQRALAIARGTTPPRSGGHRWSEGAKAKARAAAESRRKPRQNCVICGTQVPYRPSKPNLKTCSSACLKQAHAKRGDESLKNVREAQKAKRAQQKVERDALILKRYGDGLLIRDIASEVGASAQTVKKVLRDSGVDFDGRSRRAPLTAKAKEAKRLTREEADAALGMEFDALGGGLDAVAVLAERRSVSRRAIRVRLLRSGRDVPDARHSFGQKLRKERGLCVMCGREIPFVSGNARRKTCSSECTHRFKSEAMRAMRARQATNRPA